MENARVAHQTADPFSRKALEFSGVVDVLRHFVSGPIGLPLLAALEPGCDIERIRRELERVKEARGFLRESQRPSLGGLQDPRPMLDKLRVEGVSLPSLEVLALVELARAAQDLRKFFLKGPFLHLADLLVGLADFHDLIVELGGKILPDGFVDSSASPQLARIRRSIERLRQEVQSSLERLLRRFTQDGILQDAIVTIRNDRLVIPVRAEEKRKVPGVVHGASSSGATVYLEPLETVPLNNELVELQDQEVAEIHRILGIFSDKLRARWNDLAKATKVLSELDLAFAKAEFARRLDCCLPEFVAERELVLKDVRHPLLEKSLEAQDRKPVPLTVELKSPKTLMIISGPNTGGKTVAMKAIGISVLMAQAGLPVAASEARLPVFGRVLADIGDPQSIEANLSTFSGHVVNIQSMVERADRDDLVLLDEIGSSTEPHEGAALAVAILERFREIGATTFVTTHHARLKAYAAETPEAVNAAMEFDENTLQPTYRLLIGLPGKSSALDIASRLGLEASIVHKARSLLEPGEREAASMIASLHEKKSELERQLELLRQQGTELEARKAKLEREFQQERRAKLKELDTRLEQTLRQFDAKLENAVAEMRDRAGAAKSAKRTERKSAVVKSQAREEWNAQVLETLGADASGEPGAPSGSPVPLAPLGIGDRVQVGKFSTDGTVIALPDKDSVEVEVGRMRMTVQRDEVRVTAPASQRASWQTSPQPRAVAGATSDVPLEINVIGCTAEEAREQVDKFLDQAYVAGRFRLRVVHGHGKGILKKTLHEMFASHPHVEKFYLAPQNEGGSGATLVELKL